MSKLLSIIIPIYKVEQYVRTCLESVYRQNLDENSFEVILVNDGTPDNSMAVIADLIAQHWNILVIEQTNQGLSLARNHGLEAATGKYVLFLDSDDLFIDHSIAPMLQKAMDSEPDLVFGAYWKMEGDVIETLQGRGGTPTPCDTEEKTGHSLLLEDLNAKACYVWRTLYRREFLTKNNILFIAGIYYEDIAFTHECLIKARKCLRTRHPFYIYRIGHSSITRRINKKSAISFAVGFNYVWAQSKEVALPVAVRNKLRDNTFELFSVLVYAVSHEMESAKERADVVRFIEQHMPDLRFTNGLKQRLVSTLYRLWPKGYVELRARYTQLMT